MPLDVPGYRVSSALEDRIAEGSGWGRLFLFQTSPDSPYSIMMNVPVSRSNENTLDPACIRYNHTRRNGEY
ncbi:hypothetical protein TNCV_4260531 [Trichonephila clavipes]|nr:hypothetical protein TNCV_4260531 [Trichonephila clavipes]